MYSEHRLAWFMTYGEWPKEIDHVNGNCADNRISNLRLADRSTNSANQRKHRYGKNPFKGVTFERRGQKWVARIQKNGKQTHLGSFQTVEEARLAYIKAAVALFGEFARP